MFEDKTPKEPEDIFAGTDEVPPARQSLDKGGPSLPDSDRGQTLPSSPDSDLGQAGTPAKTVTPTTPPPLVRRSLGEVGSPPVAPPETPLAPAPPAEERVVLEEPKKSWGRLLVVVIAIVVILGIAAWIALQYSDYIFKPKEEEKAPGKITEDEIKVMTPTPSQTVPEIEAPVDSDNDGLTDEEELLLGTDALLADSDADGLPDRDEVKIYKTDPLDSDTDKDGYFDGEEVQSGYDPKGKGRLYEVPAP